MTAGLVPISIKRISYVFSQHSEGDSLFSLLCREARHLAAPDISLIVSAILTADDRTSVPP